MASPPDMRFRSVHLEAWSPGPVPRSEASTVSVVVQASGLLVQELDGHARSVDFVQVLSILPAAYRLEVRQLDQSVLTFSQLGYDYDSFVYQVFLSWNAFVSDARFIDEPCLLEVKGDVDFQAPAIPLLQLPPVHVSDLHGDARFRLHASSLMVLPLRGPVLRIPLCFVQSLRRDGWQIVVLTDQGERLSLGRLGYETDAMLKALEQAVQTQTSRALALLKQVLGMLDPPSTGAAPAPLPEQGLQAAAWLLREGRAVDWQVLEQTCPGLTGRLDLLLRQWSPAGYYEALLKMASEKGSSGFAIGIRREQGTDSLGDGAGDAAHEAKDESVEEPPEIPAFWLAVPLLGQHASVAVELVPSEPLAQATYLFRMDPDPAVWPQFRQLLDQGLEAVDFRRQPIYFPLEKLQQPSYLRDLAALRFCPPLAFLRRSFTRRLIHTDLAGWQATLSKAMQKEVS
jgi:hypothetical protein